MIPRQADWKDKPVIDKAAVETLMTAVNTEREVEKSKGLGENTMIGTHYAGNVELYNAAVDSGECYEGDDGKWYA